MGVFIVPTPLQQGLAVTDSPTFFALTLTSPLTVPNGGTGLATLAAGRIPYGAGAAAFASSAALVFDGTNLGVGTGAPQNVLDVLGATTYVQERLTETKTTATLQRVGLVAQHYVAAEEPLGLIMGRVDATTSEVAIGGYATAANAATKISFYTAANNTTVAGTERMSISSAGSVVFATTGPHAIGAGLSANNQLSIAGAFTGSALTRGLVMTSDLTGVAGADIKGVQLNPTMIEAGSGVHSVVVAFEVIPAITAGAATVTDAIGARFREFAAASGTTNASTVKIEAAPTGATNMYALWVAAGLCYFAGTVQIGNTQLLEWTTGGPAIAANAGAGVMSFTTNVAALTLGAGGTTRLHTLGAFAAGDKYVIADANGNLHVSALGPAS